MLFVALLVARRIHLARAERRQDAAEKRLLPLALELVEGERERPPSLSRADQTTLAAVLGRYARLLKGDARANIGAYFRGSSALRHELAALSARRTWRRATAAYVLGDMASSTAVPALLKALDDDEREVRTAAVRSLSRLGAVEAVEPIVAALATGTVPHSAAGQALLDLGTPALPALHRLLESGPAPTRAVAAELVGLIGSAVDAQPLYDALRDPSAEVRAKAARALGRAGASDAAAQLREALSDRVPFVRVTAARALGEIGDREAIPRLLEQAREARFEVAQAAAHALVAIDPEVVRRAGAEPDAGPHLHEAADLVAI